MSSGDASRIVQCNVGQLQVALHKEWARIPQNVVRRYMLSVRPRYDAVIAAGDGHARILTNLTQLTDLDENEIFIIL